MKTHAKAQRRKDYLSSFLCALAPLRETCLMIITKRFSFTPRREGAKIFSFYLCALAPLREICRMGMISRTGGQTDA
jgi:hypothetical protein